MSVFPLREENGSRGSKGVWVESRRLCVEGVEGKIQISHNLAENVDYTERHLAEGEGGYTISVIFVFTVKE